MSNKKALSEHYGEEFYDCQMSGSYRSAVRYTSLLAPHFRPVTVADVGCGRGTWLKAFREAGAAKVVGFDGPWNSQEKMVDAEIRFFGIDLNHPKNLSGDRFDLAISLEVAEHLEETSSDGFVSFLMELSDVVLFAAAFTGQGGTNHINEQPHSYWAEKFIARGYLPFDIFRADVWGESDVQPWYRQNTFLYVREGSSLHSQFHSQGLTPITNLQFMNCLHPDLYLARNLPISTGQLVKTLGLRMVPTALRPTVKKIFGKR